MQGECKGDVGCLAGMSDGGCASQPSCSRGMWAANMSLGRSACGWAGCWLCSAALQGELQTNSMSGGS